MKTRLFFFAAVAGLVTLIGCSTPETRIKKNPEAFARLTPAQQQMIREGRVDIGFDMEMVKLALGDPDHVRERLDAHGRTESWDYVTYEGPDGVVLYSGFYHRRFHDPLFPYYLDSGYRREHSREKVIFKDGQVISVEQDKSDSNS